MKDKIIEFLKRFLKHLQPLFVQVDESEQ